MSAEAKVAQTYCQVAAATAGPGQRVAMLYDGAIRFLERAQSGFQSEDPLERNRTVHNNITRAQAIIDELNLCLNIESGGELAAALRRLYGYFSWRLDESNRRKHPHGVQEVVRRLTVLRDAWNEMLQKHEP